jgi:hypothetical protein
MTQPRTEGTSSREVLKTLRGVRRDTFKTVTLRVKEQQRSVRVIKQCLAEGAATVPEISEATGIKAAEVLWYVATLKNYGEIIEGPKDGDYFRYQLVGGLTGQADEASVAD